MSRLYQKSHRVLQDEFGTRELADRVESFVCLTEFSEESKEFIETQISLIQLTMFARLETKNTRTTIYIQ